MDITPLFSPLKVKGKTLRNRIVMPPMVSLYGITTRDGVDWYGSRARGGVGLVIVEATAVNRFGTELTVKTLKTLVDAIHEGGALAAIQLFPVTFDFPRVDPLPTPNTVDRVQIEEIVGQFHVAAQICMEAGFDGVEPHGAHNYLINQFFSPLQNGRTDAFGGNMKNRMRFALRIVETVRDACGPEALLLYRHTPVGQGYGIDESLILASRLAKAGVDILDVSPSSFKRPGDRAMPFRGLGIPVVAVGEMDVVERALEVVNERRADLVAVGRGLIADPQWPNKVREGRFDEIVVCQKCDEGCFGNLREGIPIKCVEW